MSTTTDQLPPASEDASRLLGLRLLGLRVVGAFVIGLAVVAVVVVAGALAFERQYEGRVLPGVRVGGVDLSGLTPGEAKARLSQAYGWLGDGRIVIAGPDGDSAITYAEINRGPDVGATVARALVVARAGTPLEHLVAEARTALRGAEIAPSVVFDRVVVADRLGALTRPLDRDPIDAAVVRSATGFTITPATEGRKLDDAPALESILATLARVDAPPEIRVALALQPIEPAVADADARLARVRAERMARDLVLAAGDEKWTVAGKTVAGWIRFAQTADGRYEPSVERAAIIASLEPLARKIDRAPVDAAFLIGKGDQIVGVQPGVNGRELDTPATADLVAAALMARAPLGAPRPAVEPALRTTTPALTTDQAATVAPTMSMISTWTTYYPIGEKNGFGANISVPARLIDGTVVAPGGVFDFWKVVGEVTREKGYRQGGAIINGRTEPQGALAGGICSASTTIFNAGLRAGLLMGARRNHYYYIDRYPLGLDATVFISASGSTQSMSFTNDTPYPLLIRGKIRVKGTKGYVTFEVWSVPTGRRVEFSEPTVKNRKPATTIIQKTATLPAGRRKQIEYPVEGKDVWRTRTVYDAEGNVIHRETYYSHYARITGIILVGTGGSTASPTPSPSPATPPPSPEPSPSATP